jgi:hypothetical protein
MNDLLGYRRFGHTEIVEMILAEQGPVLPPDPAFFRVQYLIDFISRLVVRVEYQKLAFFGVGLVDGHSKHSIGFHIPA